MVVVDLDELRVLLNRLEEVVICRQVARFGWVGLHRVFLFGVDGHGAVQVDVVEDMLEEEQGSVRDRSHRRLFVKAVFVLEGMEEAGSW